MALTHLMFYFAFFPAFVLAFYQAFFLAFDLFIWHAFRQIPTFELMHIMIIYDIFPYIYPAFYLFCDVH